MDLAVNPAGRGRCWCSNVLGPGRAGSTGLGEEDAALEGKSDLGSVACDFTLQVVKQLPVCLDFPHPSPRHHWALVSLLLKCQNHAPESIGLDPHTRHHIMPIKQLPQLTIRQLGSSTAISSPVSLVKELVENSIDAEASSIEVTISPNVVDKIQVRDNGNGISPQDYDALGRRAHTSKLRTFEELQCQGGRTLGFRGDALASANTLSTLTITTRTDEDPVANLLTLKPAGGGISARKPVSAPVGTTVEAAGLFNGFPVRKKHAISQSKKFLREINELLYSYALTRPRIRLSLKVAKHSHFSWSYAPGREDDFKHAALQVFGKKLVSQCV